MKHLSTGLSWNTDVETKAKDDCAAAARRRGKGCLRSRSAPFAQNV